jgi:CheY-like chemotaxis protein
MDAQPAPRVLIVEDNPGDVFLLEECLRELDRAVDVLVAKNVDEGIALLERDTGSPLCLALIDLHMPKRDGKALLAFIRDQPRLTRIPAVVLSSSRRPADREECVQLGAREVLAKPSDWEGYRALVVALGRYWGGTDRPN